jgi:hypothetical protein
MVATLHNKPPFDLDGQILRYLSELENGYEKRHQSDVSVPEDDFLKQNRILILRFEKGENIDHYTDDKFSQFVSYFEKKKILHFHDFHEYWQRYLKKTDVQPILFFELKDPYAEFEYSPYIYVEVLDIKALKSFRKKYVLEKEPVFRTGKLKVADQVVYEQGIFQYGLKTRYALRSKNKIALMEELWKFRNTGKKNKKEAAKAVDQLACHIFNTNSKKDVTKSQLHKIDRLVIGLNSYFKEKELPLEIKKRNGSVQLYVTKGSKD